MGGAERQLALLLPELRERGFDPHVATLRRRGPNFEALRRSGIPARCVEMRSRFDLAGMARAYGLWRLRPDVVLTSSVDAQVLGALVALRAGARHVTVEHGGPGLPRAAHRRVLVRLVAPSIDRVVAVSETQAGELRLLGFRADRITVIPNGIPAPVPARSRDAVRAELGAGDGEMLALLAATLRPEKRASRFVDAVVSAHSQEPRVHGVVAGDGPELQLVRSAAAQAPDAVRVLGERSDVPDLMAAADVVCLTSAAEALPLSVLEAMALGRPVLATGVGGIGDAVTDGVAGRVVPPEDLDAFVDALVALARQPEERRRLGDGARRDYERRYTLERMADRYAELLAGVAKR